MHAPEIKRLLRFGLTGTLNTGIDWLVFFVLTGAFGLPAPAAQAIAFACGVANSWFLNSRWVFAAAAPETRSRCKLLRFLAVTSLSTAATAGLMLALSQTALSLVPAKILVTLLGMGLNYLLYRAWVFGGIRTAQPRSAKTAQRSG